MTSTSSLLIFGLALSAVQLSLGIAIGLWCARRRSPDDAASNQRAKEQRRTTTRLLEWTRQVAEGVHDHNDAIGEVHCELARIDDPAAASETAQEHVLGLIHHLSLANESLQSQLTEAETNLEHQAAELEAQLTEARTDALTGLANRRSFDESLGRCFGEWSRYGQNASLLLLDLDRFKDVNDRHGHLAGDAVLKQIAEVFGTARETDIVTRYGGEEFAIILPHTDINAATIAAERIRADVAATVFEHGDTKLSLTISYGLAQFEERDAACEAIVERADSALYASKIASRNNGHLHDGYTCIPIAPSTESPDTHDANRVLSEAADILRQQMHEVVGESRISKHKPL